MRLIIAITFTLLLIHKLVAAEAEEKFSCETSPTHRAFDFWLGEWDVYVEGKKRARSVISKRQNGCMIHEAYTSERGWHGESMNFVNPATGKWNQVWVDQDAGLVTYEGGFSDGAMRMSGRWTFRNGTYELARVTWTRNENGTVEHLIRHSKDEGKSWYTYFKGHYKPHSD